MKVNGVGDTFFKLNQLYQKKVISSVAGNYSNYKKASVQYAELALDNVEIAKKITPIKYSFPIFSKTSFNVLKITFMDLFRKKTPAEKQLKIIGQEEAIKRQIFQQNFIK